MCMCAVWESAQIYPPHTHPLIYICDVAPSHSNIWHDSLMYVTWLIHICHGDMTQWYLGTLFFVSSRREWIKTGIVAFNFSPRNLPQVTSAMKSGQGCMIWVCFGEESISSRRVILKIELELNSLNSILSWSAVTPVFPLPLAQVKACRGWSTH